MSATPEAIALAANLIAQVRGDIPQTRRSVQEALSWLCSIDPSHKPAEAQQMPPEWAKEREELLQQRNDWQARSKSFCEERDQARREAGRIPQLETDLASWRARAERAERAAVPKPTPAPAPAATPAPVPKPTPAATPAPAADPWAHLPPVMREFARKQALEID